jgi:hypothetical protein
MRCTHAAGILTFASGLSKHKRLSLRSFVPPLLLLSFFFLTSGCATPAQTAGAIAGGIVATTVVGARSPGQEIEQVYYLGVFDPQEQVPPTVYRLTVHGQASAISGVKFASGWVPSIVIDSLAANLQLDPDAPGSGLSITKDKDNLAEIQTGRRMIQFGPEGFREAPRNHRLVIVMGQSPKKFFEAIDEALGSISGVQAETANFAVRQKLFQALVQAQKDQERLSDIDSQISAALQN